MRQTLGIRARCGTRQSRSKNAGPVRQWRPILHRDMKLLNHTHNWVRQSHRCELQLLTLHIESASMTCVELQLHVSVVFVRSLRQYFQNVSPALDTDDIDAFTADNLVFTTMF